MEEIKVVGQWDLIEVRLDKAAKALAEQGKARSSEGVEGLTGRVAEALQRIRV